MLPPQRAKGPAPAVPWGPLVARMWPVTLTYFCYGWCLWLYLSFLLIFFKDKFGAQHQRERDLRDDRLHDRRHRQHHRRRGVGSRASQERERPPRADRYGRVRVRRRAGLADADSRARGQGSGGVVPVGRLLLRRDGDRADVGDSDGHRAEVFRNGVGADELGLGAGGDPVARRGRIRHRSDQAIRSCRS